VSQINPEDKLAIHELLNKAAYGYDAREIEMLSNCFTEDAVMTMRVADGNLIGPYKGNAAIMGLMTRSMEQQTDKRLHGISNIFFENEGNESTVVLSSLTLIATDNGKANLLSTGIYRDEVVKAGNRWQIKKRHLELELPF
jgi:hypothetical protein